MAQLWAVPTHPITGSQAAELSTSLSTSPPQAAAESNEVAFSLLLSKPDKPRVLNCSSQAMPSSPFTSFVALVWTHSRTFTSFLNSGAQTCTSCSRWGLPSPQCRGTIPSPVWLAVLSLMHPRVVWFALRAARAWSWLLWSLLMTSTPRPLSAGLLSQFILVPSITLSQVQNLAFGLVKCHPTDHSPMCQSSRSLYKASCPSRELTAPPTWVVISISSALLNSEYWFNIFFIFCLSSCVKHCLSFTHNKCFICTELFYKPHRLLTHS